jgi:hypothetical protein
MRHTVFQSGVIAFAQSKTAGILGVVQLPIRADGDLTVTSRLLNGPQN